MTLLQHLHHQLIMFIKSKTGTGHAPIFIVVIIFIVVVIIIIWRVVKHAYGICKRNMLAPWIHSAQMKHSYNHTAYCQFGFCLATTRFLESCSNTKYSRGHSPTFPHPPGVLQYLTTLTNTQHVPARTATGNMLDESTCMMSRPADSSNDQWVADK